MRRPWVSAGMALAMAIAGCPTLWAQDTAQPPEAPPVPMGPLTVHPSSPARTVEPTAVAADALIVRPLGFAATVLGSAIFVVALPFAALTGDVKRTGKVLVGTPADFTFKRKLGDFDEPTN